MNAAHFHRGALSLEVVLHILSYGDLNSIANLRACSKTLFADGSDSSVWRRLLIQIIPHANQVAKVNLGSSHEILRRWIKNEFVLNMHSSVACVIKPRYLHRSVTLPDGRVFLFGGAKCRNDMHLENYNDIWELNLEAKATVRREVRGDIAPHGRAASAIASIEDKIYIFGGLAGHGFSNDFWCFDTTNNTWTCLDSASNKRPPPRWGHTLVAYGTTLVMFGGSNMEAVLDDLWVINVGKPQVQHEWRRVSLLHGPIGRSGHSVVMMNKHFMYIYGGNTHGSTLGDLWRVDLSRVEMGAVTCVEVHQINTPRGRIGAAMYAIGDKIFMFGGRDKMVSEFLNGFFVFDSNTCTWKTLGFDSSRVQPRTGHCAFGTPNGLCFFGGYLGGVTGQGSFVTNQFVFLDIFGGSTLDPTTLSHVVSAS